MRGEKTFEAYWDNDHQAKIYLNKDYYNGNTETLTLQPSNRRLTIQKVTHHNHCSEYAVELPNLDYEARYSIEDDRGLKTRLQFGRIVEQESFDAHFATDVPLGAIFNEQGASFSLWAPTADQVYLKLFSASEGKVSAEIQVLPLNKSANGVWNVHITSDKAVDDPINQRILQQSWIAYRYLVCIDGLCQETQDPYCLSTLPNAEASVVIKAELLMPSVKPSFWRGTDNFTALDAVIYEVSVRDITQHVSSGASYPGTFEGLTEELQSTNDRVAGRSYIKELGITHVQLLPIYDFGSVDERAPRVRYNWGYDPIQYFSPEGSLSAFPEDPLARVKGLQNLVSALHQDGLGVIMDVVYNHMFDRDTSPLHRVVPGYYFRVDSEGKASNGSFCGNDLDSTKRMMRRLVVDCTRHWMTTYGIDGFRFDLMGILDIETMNAVRAEVLQNNPFGLVYGEGWNMPTALKEESKAMMDHAEQMPNIGFFNDRYRDFYKGATMTEAVSQPGLLTGSKRARAEWLKEDGLSRLFFCADVSQHIQYMECHDNHTLWDKLMACAPELSEVERRQLQRSLNAFLAMSFGVPFFHCGQEWYRTKGGDHNSYRSGDLVNAVDWTKVHEGEDGIASLREVLQLRKCFSIFKETNLEEVLKLVNRTISPSGLLTLTVRDQFTLFFNLSRKPLKLPKMAHSLCFTTEGGPITAQEMPRKKSEKVIPAYTICVLSHI